MAKFMAIRLALDEEVVSLVKRVGALPQPGNHIHKYTVMREASGLTLVTVTMFADAQFSDEPKQDEKEAGESDNA